LILKDFFRFAISIALVPVTEEQARAQTCELRVADGIGCIFCPEHPERRLSCSGVFGSGRDLDAPASPFAEWALRAQHRCMTVRPPSAVELPHLVRKSRRALELEARALKGALDEYASSVPKAECPHQADVLSAKRAGTRVRSAQRQLLASGQQQARLILVNAYDHVVSMGRLLGADGSMPLYAHTTLSRSVCEAAVRHAWLLGASLSYEERITRSAAGLIANTENRLKGAKDAPERNMGAQMKQALVDNCTAEDRRVRELIERAGMDLVPEARGRKTARVELRGTAVKGPVKVDIGPLMAELLPESPGWYLLSSGIAHSAAWVLHAAVTGPASKPELALTRTCWRSPPQRNRRYPGQRSSS
jgi:hypothetical protein